MDGKLYAYSAEGTRLFTLATGGPIRSSPVLGLDGTVYFGSTGGNLYAVKGNAPPAAGPWPMHQRDARHTGRGFQLEFAGFDFLNPALPRLTLKLERDRDYVLESSPDLFHWTRLTNFTSTNTLFQFIAPNPPADAARFYRAMTFGRTSYTRPP